MGNSQTKDKNAKSQQDVPEPEPEPVVSKPLIPELDAKSDLLSSADIQFLAEALPSDAHRELWHKMFHSATDGMSFNRFGKGVSDQNAFLVVVRDEHGRRFGGFVSEPLKKSPEFTGNAHCFVFELGDDTNGVKSQVYRPSGINKNYVYYNHSNTVLPNCFAMGGQQGYWGFSIDDAFEGGMSRGVCTTYKSPCLAGDATYAIRDVEAWGTVRPIVPSDSDDDDHPQSALHGDATGAKMVMDLAGARTETSVYGDEYAGNI